MLAKTIVLLGLLALTYAAPPTLDQSYEDEPVVVVRSPLTRKMCPDGTYMNRETNECENCRECGEYMYIRRECSRFSNTECGWCGSTQIVKSEDFIRKCQFTFYKEIRQKLRREFGIDEAEEDDGDLVEERKIEDSEGKIHVVHLQRRTDLDEEDSKDLRLADEEDFMKRPVVYLNNQDEDDEEEESEEDLTSSEIDEEVHAEMVDEHDIGESPDSEDSDDTVEEVRPKDMEDNEAESQEDLPVLVRADEIREIPMKIVVNGNIQKFEESEEENSSSDSDEEDEDREVVTEEAEMAMNDKLLSSNSRTLLRICLMSLIVIIIYMWVSKFMSRRRRHHILVLPDLNTFTEEQKKMMESCACQLKNKEEGHCYENKLAYI